MNIFRLHFILPLLSICIGACAASYAMESSETPCDSPTLSCPSKSPRRQSIQLQPAPKKAQTYCAQTMLLEEELHTLTANMDEWITKIGKERFSFEWSQDTLIITCVGALITAYAMQHPLVLLGSVAPTLIGAALLVSYNRAIDQRIVSLRQTRAALLGYNTMLKLYGAWIDTVAQDSTHDAHHEYLAFKDAYTILEKVLNPLTHPHGLEAPYGYNPSQMFTWPQATVYERSDLFTAVNDTLRTLVEACPEIVSQQIMRKPAYTPASHIL